MNPIYIIFISIFLTACLGGNSQDNGMGGGGMVVVPAVCDVEGQDPDQDGWCSEYVEPYDNCPSVYNPGQENADGQYEIIRAGDVCDACPFDPLEDPDRDMICEDVDNCPAIHNPDQADRDGDGFGDACDQND